MTAGLNAIHKAERSHQTNRAVPAHSQITYVVEKDDSRRARRINRFAQERADDDIGTARFVDGRRTITVVFIAEIASRSAIEPLPSSGPPPTISRVGSPPVCESITSIRFIFVFAIEF